MIPNKYLQTPLYKKEKLNSLYSNVKGFLLKGLLILNMYIKINILNNS